MFWLVVSSTSPGRVIFRISEHPMACSTHPPIACRRCPTSRPRQTPPGAKWLEKSGKTPPTSMIFPCAIDVQITNFYYGYYRCLLSMFTIDVYYRYAQGFTIGHMLSLLSLCCRHWSLWDWLLQPGATRCLLQGVHMFIGQSSLRHCSSKSKRCLRS